MIKQEKEKLRSLKLLQKMQNETHIIQQKRNVLTMADPNFDMSVDACILMEKYLNNPDIVFDAVTSQQILRLCMGRIVSIQGRLTTQSQALERQEVELAKRESFVSQKEKSMSSGGSGMGGLNYLVPSHAPMSQQQQFQQLRDKFEPNSGANNSQSNKQQEAAFFEQYQLQQRRLAEQLKQQQHFEWQRQQQRQQQQLSQSQPPQKPQSSKPNTGGSTTTLVAPSAAETALLRAALSDSNPVDLFASPPEQNTAHETGAGAGVGSKITPASVTDENDDNTSLPPSTTTKKNTGPSNNGTNPGPGDKASVAASVDDDI